MSSSWNTPLPLFLFHKILKEYEVRIHPLWSEIFSDIDTEIYRLLEEGKEADTCNTIELSVSNKLIAATPSSCLGSSSDPG